MNENIILIGAGAFGALIGWFVYYINRYRKGDVQFSDLTTLIGIIGGGAIMALFETIKDKDDQIVLAKQEMFGAYGIGLFLGFFGYFVLLLILVNASKGAFTWTWFLDGRRKNPDASNGEDYPGGIVPPEQKPMDERVAVVEDRLERLALSSAGSRGDLSSDSVSVVKADDSEIVPMYTVNPNAARIISTCEEKWEASKTDCNAFVKAVAEAVGVSGLEGNADKIVDIITSTGSGWRKLHDGVEAKAAADGGELVIGGLRGSEQSPVARHGHVVVVVTGGLAHGKYPTAYWGSLGGIGKKNTTVNYSWKKGDRDKVHYAAKTIA